MREEDSNWFSKWDQELPPPEDLMPLSQSLITPDLALAFNIPNHAPPHALPSSAHSPPLNSSAEFDSPELSSGIGGGSAASDEPARTLKRPRLVWTPQLHKRFVDAVAHLGIKNAVPKTIMQLMSVDGLTRENVASHLQKYRLYLKRMQSISGGGGGGAVDPATDHLFASSPVPAHFLHPGRGGTEHFLPFVPVAAVHHHHHQMGAAGGPHHHHQFRHFGDSPHNGQFDHPYIRPSHQHVQRVGGGGGGAVVPPYAEELELSSAPVNGRKVLTLFPTGDD